MFMRFPSISNPLFLAFFLVLFSSTQLWAQFSNSLNASELEAQFVKLNDTLYVGKFEVSNAEYMRFFNGLAAGEKKKYRVDSSSWKKYVNGMSELETYHRNEAFAAYPVVNISHEAALAYCKWLGKTYNEKADRNFKNALFRLPTELEWEKAARSGAEQGIYAWDGFEFTDKKGRVRANFNDITLICQANQQKGKAKKEADKLCDHFMTSAPVKSFAPNALGIYNACGNVAEMTVEKGYVKGGSWYSTREKLEIDQFEMYNEPLPFVGFRVLMVVKK